MREKPLVLLCVGFLVCGFLAIVVLPAIAKFYYVHPEGVVMDVTHEGVIKIREPANASPAADVVTVSPGTPRAVVEEDTHDFGLMDPLTMGVHQFVIRNGGDAPLKLQKGATSCKCTLSDLMDDQLMPGQEAHVHLAWNTGRTPVFSHHAEVHTNDPENPVIQLAIQGSVRMRVGIDPPSIGFPSLRPDEGGTAETVVYSQVWDELEFMDGSASWEGVTWEVQQADDEVRDAYGAKVAYRLSVTVPPGRPRGPFDERLQLRIQAPGEEETFDSTELPIVGEVLGRLAVLGPAIDASGVLDLGIVPFGRGTKRRMILKVRDEEQELRISAVETVPDFIETTMEPYQENKAGLSYIEFEVPADAPACSFRGQPYGAVRIQFDHPRIDSLELKVKLAVVR